MSTLSIRYLRRKVTYHSVEARVKATVNCQQHLMESNIRDFVGANVEYLTTGDQVQEWEEVTYLGMNLESLVVAEICESAQNPREDPDEQQTMQAQYTFRMRI
jgi:hypothetical protein